MNILILGNSSDEHARHLKQALKTLNLEIPEITDEEAEKVAGGQDKLTDTVEELNIREIFA